MNAAGSLFDSYDYTCDALDLAYVLFRFWRGDAIGPGMGGEQHGGYE